MNPALLKRHVLPIIRQALTQSRVVYLNGPRQSGKTTLVRKLAEERNTEYQTLDNRLARALALDDPEEFIDRDGPLTIDEVQRGGDDLLLAIKSAVDKDNRAGQFLLTGSTRFLTVPNLSESLAGRVDLIPLWPLSQGEIEGRQDRLIDRLFDSVAATRRIRPMAIDRSDAFERVCRGGFPEAVRRDARSRTRWFDAYIQTLTQRDVGEIANIQRVSDLPALVRLLATRSGQELNVTSVASEAGIPRTTFSAYLPLLEAVFLLFRLPAWSRNLTSRPIKQPKLIFTDSGVAAHVLSLTPAALARPQAPMAGELLETFVASEVARQATWAETDVTLYHFRERTGAEVDLVLEARDGRVVAVETKAGRSVGKNDLRSLSLLRDRLGDDFVQGVVLGCTDTVQPLGDRLTLLPISALWA